MTNSEKKELKEKITNLSRENSDSFWKKFPDKDTQEMTSEQIEFSTKLDDKFAESIIKLFDK